MKEMIAEADMIFTFFNENNSKAAGSRMATMDRKYARVTIELGLLNKIVRDIQKLHFEYQVRSFGYPDGI